MPDQAVKQVVAAVILDAGKIWLIRYEDEPNWPWQLVNFRHDDKDAKAVISEFVESEYDVEIHSISTLGTQQILSKDSQEPTIALTGVKIVLAPGQTPKQPKAITLRQIDPNKLNEYKITSVYKNFIDQAIQ